MQDSSENISAFTCAVTDVTEKRMLFKWTENNTNTRDFRWEYTEERCSVRYVATCDSSNGSSSSYWQFDMMEFDRAEQDNDTIEKTSENGINTETHASGTEEDCKSCEDHEEPQKSWSLERNWGLTLEERFKLALKFFKGNVNELTTK